MEARRVNYDRSGQHCRCCGRALVLVEERSKLHDRRTGERLPHERYWECPKYARSWRNLWWGGVGHESLSADGPGGRHYV
jgi:hypothetical protein